MTLHRPRMRRQCAHRDQWWEGVLWRVGAVRPDPLAGIGKIEHIVQLLTVVHGRVRRVPFADQLMRLVHAPPFASFRDIGLQQDPRLEYPARRGLSFPNQSFKPFGDSAELIARKLRNFNDGTADIPRITKNMRLPALKYSGAIRTRGRDPKLSAQDVERDRCHARTRPLTSPPARHASAQARHGS